MPDKSRAGASMISSRYKVIPYLADFLRKYGVDVKVEVNHFDFMLVLICVSVSTFVIFYFYSFPLLFQIIISSVKSKWRS